MQFNHCKFRLAEKAFWALYHLTELSKWKHRRFAWSSSKLLGCDMIRKEQDGLVMRFWLWDGAERWPGLVSCAASEPCWGDGDPGVGTIPLGLLCPFGQGAAGALAMDGWSCSSTELTQEWAWTKPGGFCPNMGRHPAKASVSESVLLPSPHWQSPSHLTHLVPPAIHSCWRHSTGNSWNIPSSLKEQPC